MAIEINKLEALLLEYFPDATIKIKDLVGDEDHYMLDIASEKFKNLSKIEQHKHVNNALKGYLGTKLHALSIKTRIKEV